VELHTDHLVVSKLRDEATTQSLIIVVMSSSPSSADTVEAFRI